MRKAKMDMIRNPDWENARKRLEAFWHNEIIDRPCIQIYAPAPESDFAGLEPITDCNREALWNDPEIVTHNFRAEYMRTRYMGEAFPVLYPKWPGPELMLGSRVEYDVNTIWVKHAVDTILDVDMDRLTMDHPEVHRFLEKLAHCAEYARGEAFIGMPGMGNPGDTLATVCGYDNLFIDLFDNPEEVMAAEEKLTSFSKEMYDAVYNTTTQYIQGSCGWLPAWHPGRSSLIEFDMSAMISPDMYRMYLPYLLERTEYAEKSIYHLDGPDALTHLDIILAQKEFDAIQWEPGVASENILDWIPVMQKIQAAGKGLYVAGPRYSPDAILELLKNLKPEGLILPVTVSSVEEGQRFLEKVERLY